MRFLFAFCLFIFAQKLSAQTLEPTKDLPPRGESFTFYLENDTRRLGGPNSDDGYSNGVRFSYVYAEDQVPSWVSSWTDWSDTLKSEFKKSTTNFGISLAHQIYTPKDTDKKDFIPDDRPYAAWLYLGLTANFKTPTHSHLLELDLGLVGAGAMGEKVQNEYHHIIEVPPAEGWAHELATEPALQLGYTQKVRFFQLNKDQWGRYLDVIPSYGGNFGNVLISAHTGIMLRAGWNLPDDFGPATLSSPNTEAIVKNKTILSADNWRAYGFAGVKGNAIARNIFLDGNTFRDSHRVKKYPFTLETEFGYAVQVTNWSFTWRFVTVSPEFEERSEFSSYASVAISYLRDF